VLIVGNQLPKADPLYFAASMAYPVTRKDFVLSEPSPELGKNEHGMALDDLRVKLAKRQQDLERRR